MEAKLVREPIYQQLNQALRSLLRTEFQAGARFLTEREISARFRVSRATANKALANLVSERLVEFRRGIGTFVSSAALEYDLQRLVSFTTKADRAGKTPETRIVRFRALRGSEAPVGVARALGLGTEDHTYYMERLRLADHVPVILERRYVTGSMCPKLQRSDLAGSIYDLWTRHYGLQIGDVEQTIRAVNLLMEEAQRLHVAEGAAALQVRCLGRLEDGRPLWYEDTLYRGDAYEFFHRLTGASAHPTVGRLVP